MTETSDRDRWPELRRRCSRCGCEGHTLEDCPAFALYGV